jgi:flagellar FliL protein
MPAATRKEDPFMAEAVADAAPVAEKKKGRKGLVLALVGAVAVLGAGGVGAFYWMSPGAGKEAAPAAAESHGGHGGAKAEGGRHGVLSLEPFIVNLADPEGDRYIKCTMRLVLDHPDSAEAVKSDDLAITRVRDRVLTLLSSKAFAQVATPEGKESLRKEIQTQVTAVLQSASVSEVYYTEFIVQ